MPEHDLYWILNHLGEEREHNRNAVAPPVYQSAMFCFSSVAEMRAKLGDELGNPFYTRGNNPTVEILRRKMAALESAEDALVFGSGSAAIAAAVLATVNQGDQVLCIQHPYSWTSKLLDQMLSRFGITTRYVSNGSVADFEACLSDRTRMIILESPNSLTFRQQDIAGIAAMARQRNIVTLCDNSYATPLRQRPIEMGIDLVAHSATKYLNGHSDAVAGVLCGSAVSIRSIFEGPFMTLGGIIGPHDAALVIRGLRTLPMRLERSTSTARLIVKHLREHPAIAAVHYPDDSVATGMFTIQLANDEVSAAERFCDALQRFLITCSWGGHESLVYPVCALYQSQNYAASTRLPAGLIRYVG